MRRQEQRGQGKDEHHPGHDETDPAENRTSGTAEPPRAEDRQLCRGGTGQQARCRDAVLELLGAQPASLLDAETAQQSDMGRRAPKSDSPEAEPFAGAERERNPIADIRAAALEHGVQLMESRARSRLPRARSYSPRRARAAPTMGAHAPASRSPIAGSRGHA